MQWHALGAEEKDGASSECDRREWNCGASCLRARGGSWSRHRPRGPTSRGRSTRSGPRWTPCRRRNNMKGRPEVKCSVADGSALLLLLKLGAESRTK